MPRLLLAMALFCASATADVLVYQNFDDAQALGIDGQHWGFGRGLTTGSYWAGTFVAPTDVQISSVSLAVAALTDFPLSQYLTVSLMSDGGTAGAWPSGFGSIPGDALETFTQQSLLSRDGALVDFACTQCSLLQAGQRYWVSAQLLPFTIDLAHPNDYPGAVWFTSFINTGPSAMYGGTFGAQWVSEQVTAGNVAFRVSGADEQAAFSRASFAVESIPDPVPEPSTALLLGGVIVILALGRLVWGAVWLIARERGTEIKR